MILSALLLGSVIKIYSISKTLYQKQVNFAHVEERGCLVDQILKRAISMAGYFGCRSLDFSNSFDFIRGFNSKNVPSYLKGKVAKNTDVIVIEKADEGITYLTKDLKRGSDVIYVADNPARESNRELLISDCNTYQVFEAENLSKKYIKTSVIKHSYKKADTQIARFSKITFFIGKTSRKDARGKPIYALYRVEKKRAQELIEGIENMQIEYEVNGKYYKAEEVNNWKKVKAVFISLYFSCGNKAKEWKIYVILQNRV